MKKVNTLIYLLSTLLILSCQHKTYRIISYANKMDFIYPPNSKKIDLNDRGAIKKSRRFQYVFIDGLRMNKGNYYDILNQLNHAKYFSNKDSIEKVNKFQINTFCDSSITKFYKIKYDCDKNSFLLQIDFERALMDPPSQEEIDNNNEGLESTIHLGAKDTVRIIERRFFQIAKDLLIDFNKREGNGAIGFSWPTSISQNLVEKIFELIPIPQEASLTRYGWNVTSQSSFLLLNPKIALNVEISSLTWSNFPKPPGDHWYYTLLSQTKIKFYRDKTGRIKQLPFILFDENTMPSNSFIGKTDDERKDPNTVLLNNSGDLQLSDNSKSQNFIALFQNYMKQNSSYSTAGSDDDNLTLQTNRYAGNSILLLNTKLDLLLNGINEKTNVKAAYTSQGYNFKDTRDEKYSRTLITPVIEIFLKNTLLTINLGSTISTINQQFNFGSHFTIYRSFNGKYVKIKNPTNSTVLLPGDKIVF